MRPAWLGAADPEHLILPVDIIQAQPANFTRPQAVGDEQHENRTIPLVDRSWAFRRGKQPYDILPLQPFRKSVVSLETWSHDPVGNTRHAPAASLSKPKERAKSLGVVVDRPPAASSSRLLGTNGVVDVDDCDRHQRNLSPCQPPEELIGGDSIIVDRLFRQSAIAAHPCFVGIKLDAIAMAGLVDFVEPAEKAEPTDRVTDETCSRLE